MTYGVPQGSVLDPILFLLYINEICNIDGQLVSYADDTCLLFSSNTWDNVESKATVEINKVFIKLSEQKITLNIGKSVFIAFL